MCDLSKIRIVICFFQDYNCFGNLINLEKGENHVKK